MSSPTYKYTAILFNSFDGELDRICTDSKDVLNLGISSWLLNIYNGDRIEFQVNE